jgi:hypothetical protein
VKSHYKPLVNRISKSGKPRKPSGNNVHHSTKIVAKQSTGLGVCGIRPAAPILRCSFPPILARRTTPLHILPDWGETVASK